MIHAGQASSTELYLSSFILSLYSFSFYYLLSKFYRKSTYIYLFSCLEPGTGVSGTPGGLEPSDPPASTSEVLVLMASMLPNVSSP